MFVHLFLSLQNQSFLCIYCSISTNLLICFYSTYLKLLNSRFQFLFDFRLLFCQLNNAFKLNLCFNSQTRQILIKLVQFWIVRNMNKWYFNQIILVAIKIYWNQSTILSQFLHFIKYFDKRPKLTFNFSVLRFSHNWQFKMYYFLNTTVFIPRSKICSFRYPTCFFQLNLQKIILQPFYNRFDLNFFPLLTYQAHKFLFICNFFSRFGFKCRIYKQFMQLLDRQIKSQLFDGIRKLIQAYFIGIDSLFYKNIVNKIGKVLIGIKSLIIFLNFEEEIGIENFLKLMCGKFFHKYFYFIIIYCEKLNIRFASENYNNINHNIKNQNPQMNNLSTSEINQIKNQFDKEIKELDLQIQYLETSYLEQTKESGNVIRGFQNYLASKLARGAIPYKRAKIQPHQRLFSLSSTTSRANQMMDYSINQIKGQITNIINQSSQARNTQRMKRQKNVKDYVKLEKGDKQSSEKNQNESKSSSESEGGRKRKKIKKGLTKIIKKL